MDKLEMKAKRQEILKGIDAQEKQRCEKCRVSTLNTAMVHCGCPAAVEIRNLGAQYEKITSDSRKGRVQEVVEEVKREGITIDTYRKLREYDLNDTQVYKLTGINKTAFYIWKAENALTRGTLEGETVEPRKPRAYEKYGATELDVIKAQANGIDLSVVMYRLGKGWPVEKAISEKRVGRGKREPEHV